jgi:hypothetical protein
MNDDIWNLSKPRRTIHPEDALNDIKAYAKTLHDMPATASGYNKWKGGRYSQDSIRRLFGSWANACLTAGIEHKKTHIYNVEQLILHIENVAKWRRARPSGSDIKRYNSIHGTTITKEAYGRRWGGYKAFILLFSEYKLGQISKQQLIDSMVSAPERQSLSVKVRALVLQRDNWTCVDCGATALDGAKLHVHHKIPVSHGGADQLDNLVTNCADCNLGKSDKILK